MPYAMSAPKQTDDPLSTPWWKVPHMWMVVGGPLVVIVAALATAVIAIRNPDPVLNKNDYERDLAAALRLEGQARVDALAKMQPAHQARNHAASPVVPEPAK
jgi:uncharacterized protein